MPYQLHDQPVLELVTKLSNDPILYALLEQSINKARWNAEDKGLKVFPDFNDTTIWPINCNQYIGYLYKFVRWIPNEKDAALHNQEVFDMLCHFYWLIDQEVKHDQVEYKTLQYNEWFAAWLVEFAKQWGSFLDSTESFNCSILQSFINDEQYHVSDSMIDDNGAGLRPNNPSGWLSFNQFFARELNPGTRPIFGPDNTNVVTSPADCTFKNQFPINSESKITIKHTHAYSIEQLLDGSPYQGGFANGVFAHSFLGPGDYHRFHTPVAGKVLECRAIQGNVYLNVEIEGGQYSAPDGAEDGYEFTQARGLIIIDSAIGKVAILPIGMCQVSSVNMMAQAGVNLAKGDEFGYFMFGGSDIIMLFQEKANIAIDMNIGTHYDVGMQVATADL